jgi:beta-aspartyl-peptidase (threonine type)
MRKTVRTLMPVIFLACLTLSTQAQTPSADISALLHAQADAWNKGDIDGYMEGYWKSDSLIFTSGGNVQRGWNATIRKYKTTYSTREKMGRLEFSDLEISEISDSSAWVLGRWKLLRAHDAPGGVFTLILRKFSDGWKIIHDHTSVTPAADPGSKQR